MGLGVTVTVARRGEPAAWHPPLLEVSLGRQVALHGSTTARGSVAFYRSFLVGSPQWQVTEFTESATKKSLCLGIFKNRQLTIEISMYEPGIG